MERRVSRAVTIPWRLGAPALGALLIGAFLFWHSGERAGALCERERFVSSGSLSLWPPGATCTFGEPALQDTLLNPWFLATALVLSVPFALAVERRESRSANPHDP